MTPGEIVESLRQKGIDLEHARAKVQKWRERKGGRLSGREQLACGETIEDAAELAYTCRELAMLIELGGLNHGGT